MNNVHYNERCSVGVHVIDNREQRKQALRRTILDAAREVVVREGYEAFTMRKLASSIGYSPGSLYVHFESKEALFGILVTESFARLHETLQKIVNDPTQADPVERLKEGMRAYVAFGLDNPTDYRVAFLVSIPDDKRPYVPSPAFEVLRDAVTRCKKEKRFGSANAELTSQALWAAIHGITSLMIQRPTFPWARQEILIRKVIDNAVDSLVIAPTTASKRGKAS